MQVRILIVDDEEAMRVLLKRFLDPIASLIDTTDDLRVAMDWSHKVRYNVIILDLKLIGTGKEEAFRAIREFKSHDASVVVVSGLPDPNLRNEALAAGADEFVAKDGKFNERAILIATYIATLKLPRGAYKSDSYTHHVELLKQMMEHTHHET